MATDDEILARLIAKGAESRGGASEARAGGMESLREAMTAGQPTAQDAWTTAVAGALPALLGKLFGGDRGLQAGAEGGLVGAGTSMKLGADERARKEKYGALTAKTKLDQAKELDKDARLYDMEASKGGLQSAMQDERLSATEKLALMHEGRQDARTAAQIAARGAGGDKPLTPVQKMSQQRADNAAINNLFSRDVGLKKYQENLSKDNAATSLVTDPTAVSKGLLSPIVVTNFTGNARHSYELDKKFLPPQLRTDFIRAYNYLASAAEQPIGKEVLGQVAQALATVQNGQAMMLKNKLVALAQNAATEAPYLAAYEPQLLEKKFNAKADQLLAGVHINPKLYKMAGMDIKTNALYNGKDGIRDFRYSDLIKEPSVDEETSPPPINPGETKEAYIARVAPLLKKAN